MQNDRLIRITTGTSRKAAAWNRQELLWSDFLQKLSRPLRTQESFARYKSLPKPEQDTLKDIGGFVGGTLKGPRRRNENADSRDLITLMRTPSKRAGPGGSWASFQAWGAAMPFIPPASTKGRHRDCGSWCRWMSLARRMNMSL